MVFCTQARIVENWTAAFIEVLGPNERSPLLYSYWLDVSSLGLVLVKKRTQDVSIVSRAHRFDLYEEARDPPYLPMQPFILSRLDVVFPISEHGRAYLLLQNPSLAPRCEVARLGVVDPGIRCAASGDSELRIVSCSLLKPVKRVDRLIDGIREVARFHPEIAIKWYHMGDGSLRSELERRASDRLPATVSWTFAGQISNEEVIAYYRTHPVDVFVNVSESEGIPVSIMEALSYGIPVIAPRVGGIPEAVNDANGVLLSHNPSPAEIGEALASFVEQGAVTIDQRRERSKDMWRRHFNADVNYVGFARRIRTLAT
jgi:glycosyltransferase involved in cell wall biosynthesis